MKFSRLNINGGPASDELSDRRQKPTIETQTLVWINDIVKQVCKKVKYGMASSFE